MTPIRFSLRRYHMLPAAASAVVAALATFAFVVPGSAGAQDAATGPVPPPPAVPTSADQIQNLDQVKTAIKGYYDDTQTTTPDPVNGATMLHVASPDGNYAKEMASLERYAKGYLDYAVYGGSSGARKPAIVLDVDDTTLNTYNYEIYSNFVYNPTTNAAFVNAAAFPAVFGMPQLVKRAIKDGYTIFFLTGRPEAQRAGTLTNLTQVGYQGVSSDRVFLKDYTVDTWLSSCAPSCTTIQYKSLTRQHIQSLGYRIIGNFGDQYSDLSGGFAKKTFKLPNPMYYLP